MRAAVSPLLSGREGRLVAALAAVLVQTFLVWPFLAWGLAVAGGDPPARVMVGLGPPLWRRPPLELCAIPTGAALAWPDERPGPPWVGLGSHGLLAVLWVAVGLAVDADALGAALAFGARVATFRDTGAGGFVGGWAAGSARAAVSPAGVVVAGLALHAVFNVVLTTLQVLLMRSPLPWVYPLLPLFWLAWMVWLDL